MMKLDVQGSELLALEGAIETLKSVEVIVSGIPSLILINYANIYFRSRITEL